MPGPPVRRCAHCAACWCFLPPRRDSPFGPRLIRFPAFAAPQGEAGLRLHVIDVGKADALLLECEGHAALLDGGTSASGDRVVDYLLRLGIESLDYAIVSHPDSDHTGGLSQVLEEVPVGELVVYPWPEAMRRTLEYRALEDAARSSAVPVRQVRPGENLSLGGTKLEVLGPLRDYEGTNDCSLVLRLDYLGFSALFCGDIEYQAELDLVKSSVDLDADLLKVAHHGSAGSSSQRFLEAVSPTYAAISVGPDNSNLPREETLLRLESVERRFTEPIPMGTWYSPGTGKNCPFGVNFTTQWKGQKRSHETACHRPFRGQICHLHR